MSRAIDRGSGTSTPINAPGASSTPAPRWVDGATHGSGDGDHAPLAATRARIRQYALCDALTDGRSCPRIAVSAVRLPQESTIAFGFESRCPQHSAPTALRICIGCKGENTTRDAYHCWACRERDEATS